MKFWSTHYFKSSPLWLQKTTWFRPMSISLIINLWCPHKIGLFKLPFLCSHPSNFDWPCMHAVECPQLDQFEWLKDNAVLLIYTCWCRGLSRLPHYPHAPTFSVDPPYPSVRTSLTDSPSSKELECWCTVLLISSYCDDSC